MADGNDNFNKQPAEQPANHQASEALYRATEQLPPTAKTGDQQVAQTQATDATKAPADVSQEGQQVKERFNVSPQQGLETSQANIQAGVERLKSDSEGQKLLAEMYENNKGHYPEELLKMLKH